MAMSGSDDLFHLLEKKRLLEAEVELRNGLPHLYGMKRYPWQKAWIEQFQKKYSFLIAGNQQGKSVCNVIKWITWCTSPEMWPQLWPQLHAQGKRPRTFWILMPTKDMLSTEFKEKWEPELLPRGKFKNDKRFGWRAEFRNRHLWAIHWNTGITCYFHTYEQDVHHLQGGTVDALFVDEELPFSLFPELNMRIQAHDGYFHMVCTPTRGQDEWRRTYEERGDKELFPDAYKSRVTIYDCKYFEDGTRSHWTDERITQMINSCGTEAEVQLRLYGRFVAESGLKLAAFSRERNVKPAKPVPKDWLWYGAIDVGSGGDGHPPAVALLAVNPGHTKGRVVQCWRGKPSQNYESIDILNQYRAMRGNKQMTAEFYDWASADFYIVSSRAGEGFQKAEKSHEIGFPMMNTLFKNQMLDIDDTEDNQDFISEALSLRVDTKKQHAEDDAIDSVRYTVTGIPWNFDSISKDPIVMPAKLPETVDEQRAFNHVLKDEDTINSEFEEWNDLYEY